ncbi:carbon storage regulator [Fictibacillus sp. KU28468]|uniref:carbon storage regulator n=1 Tax=Fictibacillus sp. KU28468 TaxID=2991053 RepID=UPI00223DC87F|nr:carbon storage regulator [Fictibacillus sp. KU28468]UZJ79572.1 carbon storage regulator [Fictibacillus sp. KU28468]
MALVVGRKPGESIIINDNIKVTVIKTDDNMLRLKIDAPKEVSIVREELLGDNPE